MLTVERSLLDPVKTAVHEKERFAVYQPQFHCHSMSIHFAAQSDVVVCRAIVTM